MMEHHCEIVIQEATQVGSARRHAVRLAESVGMDESTVSNVAIVVTELGNNLYRYARDGRLWLRCAADNDFEVISIDRGPGLDVVRCLQDGYSTGGSSGTGLGAVRRLSHQFDAYSSADKGAVFLSRIRAQAALPEAQQAPVEAAGISLAAPGESECGDAWAVNVDNRRFQFVVADGLGHGPEAAQVGSQVVQQFRRSTQERSEVWDPKSFLERTHQALAGSRGAAVAAGAIDLESNRLVYAGIGNISATLLNLDTSKGLMSHNGTLGGRIRSVQSLDYEWPRGTFLVMHSDGLTSRWDEREYPGVTARHPAILAALLVRDHSRGRDDVTVLVAHRR